MEYIYNKVVDIFNYLTGWITATLNNILGNATDTNSKVTAIKSDTSKIDVNVSTRANASDVWNYGTRSLTSYPSQMTTITIPFNNIANPQRVMHESGFDLTITPPNLVGKTIKKVMVKVRFIFRQGIHLQVTYLRIKKGTGSYTKIWNTNNDYNIIGWTGDQEALPTNPPLQLEISGDATSVVDVCNGIQDYTMNLVWATGSATGYITILGGEMYITYE